MKENKSGPSDIYVTWNIYAQLNDNIKNHLIFNGDWNGLL